ncbi:MAG: hypothetical protein ACRELG_29745, partial [Gemmataceae bacterium]
MLSLFLILLVVFVVLSLLLAAWTLFFQAYIYSEAVSAIYWRAPAASAALTLFLLIWIVFDYRSIDDPTKEGRYHPLHDFSARETETYDKITILNQDRKKVSYTRKQQNNRYVYLNKNNKALPERPLEIIVTDTDGQEHVFKPNTDAKGKFQPENGQLRYYEDGDPNKRYMVDSAIGQITIYHVGWLLLTLILNFGFLIVWFVCLWLLLRFQWPHALGLAFVAWLISLFVLPMILSQAEKVRKDRLPPPARQELHQGADAPRLPR